VLARLETLYLNMLRVVILILATLLLIGAVLGAVTAAPLLLASGESETDARRLVDADRLADYLGERTGRATETATASAEEASAVEATMDARLAQAGKNIATYVQRSTGQPVVVAGAQAYVAERAGELAANLFDDYADSLLRLSQDLVARRDTARTALDADELVDWHHAKFAAAADEAAVRDEAAALAAQERRAQAMLAAGLAAALFLLFLLIVFAFVLVKIERNLRGVERRNPVPGPA
jgi:hypothetical protein